MLEINVELELSPPWQDLPALLVYSYLEHELEVLLPWKKSNNSLMFLALKFLDNLELISSSNSN